MPHRLDSLDGQVALITGGAGGLGSEAALWLAVAGAQVVITDVNAASLERAESRLTGELPDAKSFHYAALDVTDSAAVRDLVADIGSRYGRLDILLTSHGFPRHPRVLGVPQGRVVDVRWVPPARARLSIPEYAPRAVAP